jgi:hypothetical protein
MSDYKKSVLTFIDILGFGDIVKKASAAEIEKLLRLANESSSTSENDTEFTGRRSLSFSDTIITSCPLVGPHGLLAHGLLFNEIMNIVFLQADMIDRGETFLRGALTVGDVYHSKDMVFGPAVIDAYEIETKLCNYPRVVIDPSVLLEYENTEVLRCGDNTAEDDLEFVKSLIRQDSDGLWFVDYLKGMLGNFDYPDYYLTFLKKHKELILKKSSENKKLNGIALKYNWLAGYHNLVVSELIKEKVLSKKHDIVFKIEKEELETMHQFRLPLQK